MTTTQPPQQIDLTAPSESQARCYGCGEMFEPYTNEWFCSDTCRDAYPDQWPKTRY